jgi:hypothetical protein
MDVIEKRDAVVVDRESDIKSGNGAGMRREREIDSLSVVDVLVILRRFGTGSVVAAVANFSRLLQSKFAGGYLAADGGSDLLQRSIAAVVVEGVHERPAYGRLKPGAAVEGGIVVADRCVITPHAEIEMIVVFVLQQKTFNV